MSSRSDDVVGGVAIGLILGFAFTFLLLIFFGGLDNYTPTVHDKVQIICGYLHAQQHGIICVKGNQVVYQYHGK